MTFQYQVALIGYFAPVKTELERLVLARTSELGIESCRIKIVDEKDIPLTNPKAPLVAAFFGYEGVSDALHTCLNSLLADSTPIIPCVDRIENVRKQLPNCLAHINAIPLGTGQKGLSRLVNLILENLRLLRSERRLFISYRRIESQSVAIQLYERLDAAGFDVFLDTRSVPYGADFQSVLWHRMADSDIVVLLDTPGFRASRWTVEELTRANATNIQILHLLWPGVAPEASSAFSDFVSLSLADFKLSTTTGEDARFVDDTLTAIVERAESLRARALAARHRSLVDNFCDRAREERARAVSVQPERFILVEMENGEKVAVVPTIGVPTARSCHEIERSIQRGNEPPNAIWLLYDERGILADWVEHLDWLNKHLPISSVQISKSTDRLRGGIP